MNSSTHRSAPPNGARWLTQALEAEGVRTLFGYPGGTIMPFYDALVDSSLKHILVRHEQGAALAANGFARASNQVGVCVATSGPGASNLVTGIADAMLDSVPMVCITGQVATPLLGTDAFQELDVFGLTMPIVKHSWLVRSVDELPRVVADAFRIAREGRPGPVLIDLPKDVQLADAGHLPAHVPSSVEPPPAPAEAAIAEAIAALAAAEKPVVYAGGGIALGDAVQDLRDFVEASKKGQGFNFATAGTGSTPHFVAEMLNVKYGAQLQPVPYKSGSESTTAVLGGQVEGTSEASIIALPHILNEGKFKALATTWTQRISAYPQLSTAVEQGFAELQIAHWAGIHAPKGTPPAILDKLAAAVDKAMKEPATVEKLKGLGIEPIGGTRAEFVKFTDAERKRLGEIVKAANMQEK